jgi:hypothetical protein
MSRLEDSNSASREKARKDASGSAPASSQQRQTEAAPAAPDGEYAATGIGHRIEHEVQWVNLELEDQPFASVNLRYEFRPVLVKLGIVPPLTTEDPLTRRENARGFRDTRYCPTP